MLAGGERNGGSKSGGPVKRGKSSRRRGRTQASAGAALPQVFELDLVGNSRGGRGKPAHERSRDGLEAVVVGHGSWCF